MDVVWRMDGWMDRCGLENGCMDMVWRMDVIWGMDG